MDHFTDADLSNLRMFHVSVCAALATIMMMDKFMQCLLFSKHVTHLLALNSQ